MLNRCPTKSVPKKTPEEAWRRRKPSVSHLLIFGSLAHAHVPKKQGRKKLDERERSMHSLVTMSTTRPINSII